MILQILNEFYNDLTIIIRNFKKKTTHWDEGGGDKDEVLISRINKGGDRVIPPEDIIIRKMPHLQFFFLLLKWLLEFFFPSSSWFMEK